MMPLNKKSVPPSPMQTGSDFIIYWKQEASSKKKIRIHSSNFLRDAIALVLGLNQAVVATSLSPIPTSYAAHHIHFLLCL